MSLLNYFKKAGTNSKLSNACDSVKNDNSFPTNISADELEKVKESLKVVEGLKYKRTTYSEKGKQVQNSFHKKIPSKIPTFDRKHCTPMGKKLQKVFEGAKESEFSEHCTKSWKA